jgi:hypothetical protein
VNLELCTEIGLEKAVPLSLSVMLLHFVVPETFSVHDHVSPPRVVNEVAAAVGVGDVPLVDAAPDVQAAVITAVTASAPVQRRTFERTIYVISLSTGKPRCPV